MTTPPPPCGCRIVSPFGDRMLAAIDYCPTHLNASRLRDALEELYKFTEDLNDEIANDGDDRIDQWQSTEMQELLKRVEALLTSCRDQKGESSAK